MESFFIELILGFGLPMLALIFALEGALIGKMIPTDFILPAIIVILASASRDFILILGITSVSSTIGQIILFKAVKSRGEGALEELGWLQKISDRKWEMAEDKFERYGGYAVIASNMIPGVRGFLTIPAALHNMDTKVFAVCSFAGTLIFHTALVLVATGLVTVIFGF